MYLLCALICLKAVGLADGMKHLLVLRRFCTHVMSRRMSGRLLFGRMFVGARQDDREILVRYRNGQTIGLKPRPDKVRARVVRAQLRFCGYAC